MRAVLANVGHAGAAETALPEVTMSRWSIVVALSLVACVGVGIAGEGSAAADCSAGAAAPHVVRVARVRHPSRNAERAGQPATQTAGNFELYNLERVNAYRRTAGLPPVTLIRR
jgi:hypothetical protein